MAGYPPPYPPQADSRQQRRISREQARMQQDVLRAQRVAYRQRLRGRSRGSIVGPLLVVSIGVVFLLVQLGKLSAMQTWQWYGQWWPLFLVGVGLVLLIEWGFDRFGEQNGPRRSLGAGVIFLLVLVAGVGATVNANTRAGHGLLIQGLHLDPDNINELLGDKHESDQSTVEALTPGAALSVENPHGDLTIAGTSDDGQVHLQLHREIYSRSDEQASSKAQGLVPAIRRTGSGLSISLPAVDGARVDLSLIVPAGSAETLTADHGDIRVSFVKAPLTILANHGDVSLTSITGPTTTHINNGESSFAAHNVTGALTLAGKGHDITLSDINGPVTLGGDFFGDTHLERINGTVAFRTTRTDLQIGRVIGDVDISSNEDLSASEIVGPTTLNTRNRNVTLDRVSGDLSVINRNGSVDVVSAPPLGNVIVENRNGSVNVTLPSGAGFVAEADTTDGDLNNEFSFPIQGEDTRKSFKGTVGQGGPTIRISTTQADISLKRDNEAPLPPLPPNPPKLSLTPDVNAITSEVQARAAQALREAAKQMEAAQHRADAARKATEKLDQQPKRGDDADQDD